MHQPFGKLLRILSPLASRMWLIEGNERLTGKRLAVIWCGPVSQQAYMLNRIFGTAAPDCLYVGRRPLFMLQHLLHKYGCSLGIVAGSGRLLTRMRQDDDIEVSWWIDSELEIAAALDPEDRPRSLKEDLRRVRKNRLLAR